MEKTVNINGQIINYREEGPDNGKPILLLHGWGCSISVVASIANCLKGEMKVYSLDLPGHGKSPEPPEVWGIEEYTSCVENFIQTLKIQQPILLGHSFGGRISILLASRNPIRKIILVDSAGIKPKHSIEWYIKVYWFKLLKKSAKFLLGKEKGEKWIEEYRNRAGSQDYRQASPQMKKILSKCVNEDLKDVMPSIKASTLLVWGTNDKATPLSDAKTMEKLIPDAGLVEFPGCGHYSFLDNPVQFRAVLRSFLGDEIKQSRIS